MPLRRLLAVPLISVAAGCGGGDAETAPSGSDPAPHAASPRRANDWTITPAGTGPLSVGMTVDELGPYLGAGSYDTALAGGCQFVSIMGAPDSVFFMADEGRLARVDVRGGSARTPEGARVGDPEERIRTLYPGVRQLPHESGEGRYLVALPYAPLDTLHRLVFETDGERVTSYRAGAMPQVERVDDCSRS